jgi:outer membrane immunogenic protein
MKKVLLASTALVAMSFSASAADLARKAPPPAPVAVAPVYDWNGFYLGVMGGYGWSDRASVTVGGVTFVGPGDLEGGFVGGTLGYNFAPMGSSWLFGIEADGAWANISRSVTGPTAFGALTLSDKIDAIGSVTGRLGWTFGPGLIYAKGGWAWANQTLSATLAGPLAVVTASQSNFHSGWTVGGGLEYLFAPNWSGKIEYMYADLGTTTFGNGTLVAGGIGIGHSLHTIKGGINYHFNWGAPVVARY